TRRAEDQAGGVAGRSARRRVLCVRPRGTLADRARRRQPLLARIAALREIAAREGIGVPLRACTSGSLSLGPRLARWCALLLRLGPHRQLALEHRLGSFRGSLGGLP